MEKYASKCSLLTPEPHYIPGVSVHCPQLKYHVGKTYSQLTYQLLSPDVQQSPRRTLYQGYVPSAETDSAGLMKMLPGYTGFVPKSQNYLGCSYSETCRKALTEFHEERRARIQRQSSDLPAVVKYNNSLYKKPSPPFTAISDKVFSYKPLKPYIPLGGPYSMSDDDPNKYFIPGFRGHIPKSRFQFGKGFQSSTNQALIQFGEQQRRENREFGNRQGPNQSIKQQHGASICRTHSRI